VRLGGAHPDSCPHTIKGPAVLEQFLFSPSLALAVGVCF
jgi:hypothetical protein